MSHKEISDVQWNTIAPYLPKPAKTGRPRCDPIPEFDIFYDQYRLQHHGRIADVETFVVLNGQIQFDGIWDEDKTYSYFIASHGDKNRNWYNDVSIYANTWNHALDIYDNNSGLTKYIRYF